MPRRITILANGEFYHVFNHSVAGIPIFRGERESSLFIEAMKFYLQPKPPTKFSIYRKSRNIFPISLEQKIVTIVNYCLMPNHFHLTLRQDTDNGIKQFVQRVTNSFAHYFSVKYKKRGHVFEDKFKVVHIETTEQLLHLSRYIHLNPVTSYIVDKPSDYLYSSYNIYLGKRRSDIVDSTPVLDEFKSIRNYEEFVLSRMEYQRSLKDIEHLLIE